MDSCVCLCINLDTYKYKNPYILISFSFIVLLLDDLLEVKTRFLIIKIDQQPISVLMLNILLST